MSISPGSTTLKNIGGQDINPRDVIQRGQHEEEEENNNEEEENETE